MLVKKYKARNYVIVLGGFHASLLKEEAKACGDVVLVGDAEDTWPAFIADALNGTVQREYISSRNSDFAPVDINHS